MQISAPWNFEQEMGCIMLNIMISLESLKLLLTQVKQTLYSRFCIVSAMLMLSTVAHSGAKDLTWHSRANCSGFNESITWHLGHSYDLRTISYHDNTFNDNYDHGLVAPNTDPESGVTYINTWRSAAYHAKEAYYNHEYKVHGRHWIRENRRVYKLGETWAEDCNIYDGWWDH